MLDERLIRALHVEALRNEELHAEREPHVLFQASTIGALLEGAYEGDVSFAQLADHGDLGLGTLDHLDGEMIAIDGRFYRADVDGSVNEVEPTEGSVVGFRFPDYSAGIEVSGYHLHFISSDRRRGGHVLECRPARAQARIDPSTDLHLELPPGVELDSPDLSSATHEAIDRVEHSG